MAASATPTADGRHVANAIRRSGLLGIAQPRHQPRREAGAALPQLVACERRIPRGVGAIRARTLAPTRLSQQQDKPGRSMARGGFGQHDDPRQCRRLAEAARPGAGCTGSELQPSDGQFAVRPRGSKRSGETRAVLSAGQRQPAATDRMRQARTRLVGQEFGLRRRRISVLLPVLDRTAEKLRRLPFTAAKTTEPDWYNSGVDYLKKTQAPDGQLDRRLRRPVRHRVRNAVLVAFHAAEHQSEPGRRNACRRPRIAARFVEGAASRRKARRSAKCH